MSFDHLLKLASDTKSAMLAKVAPPFIIALVTAALTLWAGSIHNADAITMLQSNQASQASALSQLQQESAARGQQLTDLNKKVDHISDTVDRLLYHATK